jgi:hypothetical protein
VRVIGVRLVVRRFRNKRPTLVDGKVCEGKESRHDFLSRASPGWHFSLVPNCSTEAFL